MEFWRLSEGLDSHNSCEADDTLPEADTSEDNGYRSLYQ